MVARTLKCERKAREEKVRKREREKRMKIVYHKSTRFTVYKCGSKKWVLLTCAGKRENSPVGSQHTHTHTHTRSLFLSPSPSLTTRLRRTGAGRKRKHSVKDNRKRKHSVRDNRPVGSQHAKDKPEHTLQ